MQLHRWIIVILLLLAINALVLAEESTSTAIDGVSIQPTGWLKGLNGIEMGMDHYGLKWALTRQVLNSVTPKGTPEISPERWSLSGEFAGFAFQETITNAGENKIHYHAEVTSPSGVQTSQLAFSITLPIRMYEGKAIECDGKTITLPKEYKQEFLPLPENTSTIIIPTESGRLIVRGAKSVILQDPRKYSETHQWYMLRLPFSPDNGLLKNASIDLEIELQPYPTEPISITSQANMGFADEIAADGKGGWTDQGPTIDIRMLPLGKRRFNGVLFDILDPSTNNGKSCLVFSGVERPFIESATIPVQNKTFAQLYLLHAIAWSPKEFTTIGLIRVRYADDTEQTINVEFDRDVSNWWNVLPTKNGDTPWTATNGAAAIGLYLSRFAVENKPITQLTLETTGKAVWMVAGISGGDVVPRLFATNPVYTLAGKDWTPYVYDLTVQPGSVMDFSHLNDAPAGKHGRVIATKQGRFAFADAPDTPVRFYGANLCFSANFQDKAACERLAENVARMGFNTMRFHHFDCGLANYTDAQCTLNAAELDKLDYLVYCLKQKGIYVTIDLFSDRTIAKGLIPEAPGDVHHDIKALIPILDSAMKNWQAYTKSLLTHVNPYTKLAWKDDPAVFAICVDNEDNISYWSNEWPYVRELYDRKFEEWLTAQGNTSLDEQQRQVARGEFLAELQLRAYQQCRDYIRSLGCDALLTDVNFCDNSLTKYVRPELQYVDQHSYWDHPATIHRAEGLPIKSTQVNNLTKNASYVSGLFNSRVFGLPFMVTEFNMAFPNKYRSQSGVTMGAYAALQDWAGLYRFAYAHAAGNTQGVGATVWMELSQDPINMLSERIGILLFRRGDVTPATQAVPLMLTREDIFQRSDATEFQDYANLGLRYRVGQWNFAKDSGTPEAILTAVGFSKTNPAGDTPYRPLTKALAASLMKKNESKPGWITSDTGQIAIQPKEGQFAVVTDRTECFVLEQGKSIEGKIVSVENRGPFCTVAVSAMEKEKNLAEASRLLVCHMTDNSNSAAKFFDEERTITEEWGTLPQLVRQGQATVNLRLNPNQTLRVWAITMSGERKNEIPVQKIQDGFTFTVDTNQPTGGCMTYEVLAEPAK